MKNLKKLTKTLNEISIKTGISQHELLKRVGTRLPSKKIQKKDNALALNDIILSSLKGGYSPLKAKTITIKIKVA